MIHIQPPKLIYTSDDAEYVKTYVLDENGNPTDELANYEKPEDGFYAISDKLIEGLTQYAGKGIYTQLAGVKTYCYQWPDKDAYELDFPPEPAEEMPEPVPAEPTPYDLEAGKANARRVLFSYCDSKYKELVKDYPLFETTTWEKQRMEAAGELPATMIQASLLEGETEEELKATIAKNSAIFSEMAGQLIKIRRESERLIGVAENEQQINEIMRGFI